MVAASPLPTTVLAGYLGAGKTTLLNRLLTRSSQLADGPLRLAVMVNDFGDINIDASLIVDKADNTITLSNGCICCSIGGALYDAIDALLQRPDRPDHLLIEASGVAEPARIANIARAEADLQLDAVISLVDSEQFPARLNDPLIAHSVRAQVQQADWLVLTKTDVTTVGMQRKTRQCLHQLAPDKPVVVAVQGDVDPQILIGHSQPEQITPQDAHNSRDQTITSNDLESKEQHSQQYQRWSIQSDAQLSATALEQLTTDLPESLLRLKGFVGRSDQTHATLLQIVGNRVRVTEARSEQPNQTQLVAIGLDARELGLLEQRINSLLASATTLE